MFLMLNRGDYDALLTWPLIFRSTLAIIPPTGSKLRSISLEIESRAVHSPHSHVPVFFRFPHLFDMEQLLNHATQDAIYIRCVVEELEDYNTTPSISGNEL